MHPSIRLITLALATTCALAIGEHSRDRGPHVTAHERRHRTRQGDSRTHRSRSSGGRRCRHRRRQRACDGGRRRTGRPVRGVGSISKTVTGMLFAEAISRGEVQPDTTAGSLLPVLRGSPAERLTLSNLATHRSGLPVQPPTADQLVRNQLAQLTGSFPYRRAPRTGWPRCATTRSTPLQGRTPMSDTRYWERLWPMRRTPSSTTWPANASWPRSDYRLRTSWSTPPN